MYEIFSIFFSKTFLVFRFIDKFHYSFRIYISITIIYSDLKLKFLD